MRTWTRIPVLIIAAACVSIAAAQDTTVHSRYNLTVGSSANMERIAPDKLGVSNMDLKFLRQITLVNRTEILLGQLAQRNGGTWGQAYGKDMEREHALALEELKNVAQSKGISIPFDVGKDARDMLKSMGLLHGADFDMAYKNMMIKGHTQVLALVQNEIKSGHDEKVRDYAVTMEPAVKLHLRMAQQQTTMMGPG